MADVRHHRASRDMQVIFVEVPSAGSPEPIKRSDPGAYPVQRREGKLLELAPALWRRHPALEQDRSVTNFA